MAVFGNTHWYVPRASRVKWTGVQIDRFENGKIIESWVDWDKYRLFEELGFLK